MRREMILLDAIGLFQRTIAIVQFPVLYIRGNRGNRRVCIPIPLYQPRLNGARFKCSVPSKRNRARGAA